MVAAAAGDAGDDRGDSGPDTLRPATSRRTWRRHDAVRLDMTKTGPLAEPAVSVVTAFRNIVQRFPDQTALGQCLVKL